MRVRYVNLSISRIVLAQEKGQVFLETAIALPLVLFIVFSTIDFSIFSYRWAMLTYATYEVGRNISVELAVPALGGETCSELEDQFAQKAAARIRTQYPGVADVSVSIGIQGKSFTPYQVVQTTSNLPFACFACDILQFKGAISSTSQFVIENPNAPC